MRAKRADMQLLTKAKYMEDAAREVGNARSRVWAATACFENDAVTEDFLQSVLDGSRRGLDVNIAADALTFYELSRNLLPFRKLGRRPRAAIAFAKTMQAAGTNFAWLGAELKPHPFTGITHVKWTVVDNIVYAFGGSNLYADGFDYMFKVEDAELADILVRQQAAIIEADRSRVAYAGFRAETPYGVVMVDSGAPKSSTIYDRACELAEQSSEILVVSLFCPTGRLARLIKAKNSKVYFNRPRAPLAWTFRMLIFWDQTISGLRSSYSSPELLHAKFIVFTMPDGSRVAITGSHNFNYGGVRRGTREAALETSDPGVISQLESFCAQQCPK